jgi:hypothetical protein
MDIWVDSMKIQYNELQRVGNPHFGANNSADGLCFLFRARVFSGDFTEQVIAHRLAIGLHPSSLKFDGDLGRFCAAEIGNGFLVTHDLPPFL